MKRIIGLFLMLVLFAVPKAQASISNMTAQLGIYNSTDSTYGLEVDNNNTFKFAPTTSAIYYPGQTATTTTTLTAQQSGQVFVMTGASDDTRFTLPTAVVGMKYSVIDDTTKIIQLTPQAADIINFSTLTAGQSLKSSSAAKGDRIEVFCAVAGKWSVEEMSGTWAHGSP